MTLLRVLLLSLLPCALCLKQTIAIEADVGPSRKIVTQPAAGSSSAAAYAQRTGEHTVEAKKAVKVSARQTKKAAKNAAKTAAEQQAAMLYEEQRKEARSKVRNKVGEFIEKHQVGDSLRKSQEFALNGLEKLSSNESGLPSLFKLLGGGHITPEEAKDREAAREARIEEGANFLKGSISSLAEVSKKGFAQLMSSAKKSFANAREEGQRRRAEEKVEEQVQASRMAKVVAKEKAAVQAELVHERNVAAKEKALKVRQAEVKAAEQMKSVAKARQAHALHKEEEAAQKATAKQMKYAKSHIVKSEVGQDCPHGWSPIMDREDCKAAQKVLGGHDNTEIKRAWPNRPGGCYVHVTNGHVNFNMDARGVVSAEDERICEKKRVSRGEQAAQIELVKLSEDRYMDSMHTAPVAAPAKEQVAPPSAAQETETPDVAPPQWQREAPHLQPGVSHIDAITLAGRSQEPHILDEGETVDDQEFRRNEEQRKAMEEAARTAERAANYRLVPMKAPSSSSSSSSTPHVLAPRTLGPRMAMGDAVTFRKTGDSLELRSDSDMGSGLAMGSKATSEATATSDSYSAAAAVASAAAVAHAGMQTLTAAQLQALAAEKTIESYTIGSVKDSYAQASRRAESDFQSELLANRTELKNADHIAEAQRAALEAAAEGDREAAEENSEHAQGSGKYTAAEASILANLADDDEEDTQLSLLQQESDIEQQTLTEEEDPGKNDLFAWAHQVMTDASAAKEAEKKKGPTKGLKGFAFKLTKSLRDTVKGESSDPAPKVAKPTPPPAKKEPKHSIALENLRAMLPQKMQPVELKKDATEASTKLKHGASNFFHKLKEELKDSIAKSQVEAAQNRELKQSLDAEAKEEAKAKQALLNAKLEKERLQRREDAERLKAETKAKKEHTKEEADRRHAAERKARNQINRELMQMKEQERELKYKNRREQSVTSYGKAHYSKSLVGKDCPDGWKAIMDIEDCRAAVQVVGGVDQVGFQHVMKNHPQGCFMSPYSLHVSFNKGQGSLNPDDERICERRGRTSGKEREKQEYLVKASEAAHKHQAAVRVNGYPESFAKKDHTDLLRLQSMGANTFMKSGAAMESTGKSKLVVEQDLAALKREKEVMQSFFLKSSKADLEQFTEEAKQRGTESKMASRMKAEVGHLVGALPGSMVGAQHLAAVSDDTRTLSSSAPHRFQEGVVINGDLDMDD